MINKVKSTLSKYVKNGKLEQGLYKINDTLKKKTGKDYSKYVSKIMDQLRKRV
ncbi:Rv0909 family putative TA system antitoxin [Staphylococcus equorum]|uniref:hypothetical protein n=1 Tax=Staphylococcus equorum TaxID=246432 RepID=UPI00397EE985